MWSRRVNAFTSLLSVYWQRAGIFDRAIISVLMLWWREKIFLKKYIILTSIIPKWWMLKSTALNAFWPKGVWNKVWEIIFFSTKHFKNAILWVQHKWCLVLWDYVMQEKYNISYPKILQLIRGMNTTFLTWRKKPTPLPTPKKNHNKCKPNFPFHVCTNWHMAFNSYAEINPKDNDNF